MLSASSFTPLFILLFSRLFSSSNGVHRDVSVQSGVSKYILIVNTKDERVLYSFRIFLRVLSLHPFLSFSHTFFSQIQVPIPLFLSILLTPLFSLSVYLIDFEGSVQPLGQ